MRHHQFADTKPEDVAGWLANLQAPWWIAGGWAIDLYLGRETRVHADIEIGCFRNDLYAVFEELSDFEFYAAVDGSLRPLDEVRDLGKDEFGIWSRQRTARLWALEILVENGDEDLWIYRRDNRITCPFDSIATRTAGGIPYMRPEIQLLYKSKALRERDQADFDVTLPHLEDRQRSWLLDSLKIVAPDHIWIPKLRQLL